MAIGTTLRQARVQKGVSLDSLAKTTKVQARLLDAIEREAHEQLPPRPYRRGMVAAFAREVGVDPEHAVREYFADLAEHDARNAPPPPEERPVPVEDSPPTFKSAALLIVGVLAVVLVVSWYLPRTEAPDEPQPVGTAGFAPPPAPAPPAPQPRAAAAATPASRRELIVVLEAAAPSWVAASADGRRVVYRVLQPGERETVRATREIALRVGNAGALTWTVNGEDRGAMGAPGAVRDVTVSPANASTLR